MYFSFDFLILAALLVTIGAPDPCSERAILPKRPQDETNSRPTVSDVARSAGVSTATVSRVLNDSADVSRALKEKVMQTIDLLGYVRDSTARALATKRTFRLGLILPAATLEDQGEVLAAFEAALAAEAVSGARYCTLVARSTWQVEDLRRCLTHLREHGAEGAFALGELPLEALGAIAHSGEFALVGLTDHGQQHAPIGLGQGNGSAIGGPRLDGDGGGGGVAAQSQGPALRPVSGGNGTSGTTALPASLVGNLSLEIESAARKLASHLLALGHREIVIAHPREPGGFVSDAFVQGVFAEFSHQNAPAPVAISASATLAGGAHALSAIADMPKPASALLATHSAMVEGALFEAHRRGLTLPGDLSLGGILSTRLASSAHPALSGIVVDGSEIGRNAAHTLIDRVEGRFVATNLRLHFGITISDSFSVPTASG